MDDLSTRLAEAAERAAQHARPPGAAATLHRARTRRRWTVGTAFTLVVAVAAAGISLDRARFDLPAGGPATDPGEGLPWRPPVAKEWNAALPDEHPLDPVLTVAKGERAGQPWRLTSSAVGTGRAGERRAPTSASSWNGSPSRARPRPARR